MPFIFIIADFFGSLSGSVLPGAHASLRATSRKRRQRRLISQILNNKPTFSLSNPEMASEVFRAFSAHARRDAGAPGNAGSPRDILKLIQS